MESVPALSSSVGATQALATMNWLQGKMLRRPAPLNEPPTAVQRKVDFRALEANLDMWCAQCARATFHLEYECQGPNPEILEPETFWFILKVAFHVPSRGCIPRFRFLMNAWDNETIWFVD